MNVDSNSSIPPLPMRIASEPPGPGRPPAMAEPGSAHPRHRYEIPPDYLQAAASLAHRCLARDEKAFHPDAAPHQDAGRDDIMRTVREQHRARQRLLRQDAAAFFAGLDKAALGASRRPLGGLPCPTGMDAAQLEAAFAGLLEAWPGLVMGQVRFQVGARKLLMENMRALKAMGVERLYMEHLLSDLHGPQLDRLYESAHNEISMDLAEYIRMLEKPARFRYWINARTNEAYALDMLVAAAHRHGIRVIALDCAASYFPSGDADAGQQPGRIALLNFLSRQVIGETEETDGTGPARAGRHGGKWIALVERTQLNQVDDIPGLPALLGVPGIRVQDGRTNRLGPDPGCAPEHSDTHGAWPDEHPGTIQGDALLEVDVFPPPPRRMGPARHAGASPRPSTE